MSFFKNIGEGWNGLVRLSYDITTYAGIKVPEHLRPEKENLIEPVVSNKETNEPEKSELDNPPKFKTFRDLEEFLFENCSLMIHPASPLRKDEFLQYSEKT